MLQFNVRSGITEPEKSFMSESNNPFASPENQTKAGLRSAVIPWALAIVTMLAAVIGFGLWKKERTAHTQETKVLRAELDRSAADLSGAFAAIQTNQTHVTSLTEQLAELKKEKEQLGQRAKTLEDEMREQLESKDVAISKLQGKLTVTIVDRVMFDSGEAELKPDGASVMQKIADLLQGHPELKIQVVGHTDNVPIRASAHSRFPSNWELSTARALAAVHFLIENAGVDPTRLSAAGCGEFRPVAENATAEGRAKNRRIEVSILPDEMEKAGIAPAMSGSSSADATPTTATETGDVVR
jgi:chemotaxis protein MotB